MAALNLLDAASRSITVAKKGWVKKAVPDSRKGVFKKKAEAAGMSTAAYAEKEKDAPGKLGKEARLAQTLMSMGSKKIKYKSKG
jgi:hypothetical protein